MDSTIKPRKPLFALLMSMVLPGYGQLYNGDVHKAIWLFLGFAVILAPGLAFSALYLPDAAMLPSLSIGALLTLGIWLYGMVDAFRTARRRPDHMVQPWQRSGMYAMVFLLCNAVFLPVLNGYVRDHQVASFHIPSASMSPGLLPGDILFADKRYNCPGCKQAVARGDIAIFTYPNNRTLYYIKRIIGLPGDRIRIEGTDIRVNGTLLTHRKLDSALGALVTEAVDGREWQVQWGKATGATQAVEVVVPPGQVFVMGDNRNASTDSRDFGTVPLPDVVGRARQIWFSHGPDGVRWNRMGQVLH